MERMRVLSLCTGIGGIDLACETTDAMEIVGQVEIDDFCNRVLAHHWPHVQRMRDIYEVVGDEFGTIELVVAGFPCQPASVAGKRRGASDARWLWPEVARIIRRCQSAWVLLENVPGLISLGLDDVLGDLDAAGYEAAACVYPAAAVGAPHERERVFIVAHARCEGQPTGRTGSGAAAMGEVQHHRATGSSADVAHANGQRRLQPQGRFTNERRRTGDGRTSLAESDSWRCEAGQRDVSTRQSDAEGNRDAVEYASGTGCEECDPSRVACDAGHAAGRPAEAGQRGQVESGMGRSAHGLPGRLAGHPILSHRWPAHPGETQNEWEPPRTLPASDRTPGRAAQLKALGNAVVPQQVYPIAQAIAAAWQAEQQPA